jgi:hypothetical protein
MTKPYVECDFDNSKHRQRRRRAELPLEGEILLDEEPTPRIRVEVTHRLQPRRHSAPPAWIVPLVFIAALAFFSPYALIVAIVMISIFLTAYPTIAIAIGVIIAVLAIAAIRERRARRPF